MNGQLTATEPLEAQPAVTGLSDPCPDCGAQPRLRSEEHIYALGHLDVRFPTIGIEREFQQRQARLPASARAPKKRGQLIRTVLSANRHLANRMGYVLVTDGVPAYIIAATGAYVRDAIVEALDDVGDPDHWCAAIGRSGPIAGPELCGGIMAPILFCDQLYTFSLIEWQTSLHEHLGPALKAKNVDDEVFSNLSRELFRRIVHSTENIGATDAHRALNYVVLQHPGLFLAAAERAGKSTLDRIETRPITGLGTRRLVAVVVTFVDLMTGVPERLFTRIDVTEEWPFIADSPEPGNGQLGLNQFVENMLLSATH